MAKKSAAGAVIATAAAAAGVAAIISSLEKQAKQEGKNIVDVTKEKVEDFVDDVKSGELYQNISDAAKDFADSITSGEIIDKAKDTFDKTVENVKSGKIVEDLKEMAENVKDGVTGIFDGEPEIAEEEPAEENDGGYHYKPADNSGMHYVQHDAVEPKDYSGIADKK